MVSLYYKAPVEGLLPRLLLKSQSPRTLASSDTCCCDDLPPGSTPYEWRGIMDFARDSGFPGGNGGATGYSPWQPVLVSTNVTLPSNAQAIISGAGVGLVVAGTRNCATGGVSTPCCSDIDGTYSLPPDQIGPFSGVPVRNYRLGSAWCDCPFDVALPPGSADSSKDVMVYLAKVGGVDLRWWLRVQLIVLRDWPANLSRVQTAWYRGPVLTKDASNTYYNTIGLQPMTKLYDVSFASPFGGGAAVPTASVCTLPAVATVTIPA